MPRKYSILRYLKTAWNIYFGLIPKEVHILSYVQKRFAVKTPDSWIRDKCARPDWLSVFMKRNTDLSVRSTEATSMSRAASFNKHNVNQFFDNLATVKDGETFQEGNVWNLDETGVKSVQKPQSVVAT